MAKRMTPEEILELMEKNPAIRKSIIKRSFYWFFLFYFGEYMEFETAPFQREMFDLAQDEALKMVVIAASRGFGKTTIMSVAYPLWAVLGVQQKKHVLILSQTQEKAQVPFANIKAQLEVNERLRRDCGPFYEERIQGWTTSSLVIKKFDAKLHIGSVEQSIRGKLHLQYRPDLIILDDVESLDSVKTKEGRDKTWNWLTGEVFPSGDKKTKVVVVGNLLHEDSAFMRLKRQIQEDPTNRAYREFPFMDENGEPLWKAKFPTEKEIQDLRRSIVDKNAWQREFMLIIVPDEDQVIRRDWIQHYDALPPRTSPDYKYTWSGADLAISQKTTADYFAIVSAQIHGYGDELKIFILPNPINRRIPFPQQVECIRTLSTMLGGGPPARVFVEGFAYQEALPQQLQNLGYPVESVKLQGDKREKLSLTSYLVQNGQILFPKHGVEALTNQLVNFGMEKHDDLADAFAVLIHKVLEDNNRKPPVMPEIWFFD